MSTASVPEQSGESTITNTKSLKEWSNGKFDNWQVFADHLAHRQQPVVAQQLWAASTSPLKWGLSQRLLKELPRQLLDVWSDEQAACDPDMLQALLHEGNSVAELSALKALSLAHLLPSLALAVDETPWCAALHSLLGKVGGLTESDTNVEDENSNEADSSLVRQWLAIELPLVLAYLFPEFPECTALAESAFDVLIVEQDELLDSDGAITCGCVRQLPAFVASWTRSVSLARSMNMKLDGQSQEKWEWFLRFAMRLVRKNGTMLLAESDVEATPEMFAVALETSTDKEDRSIARLVVPAAFPDCEIPVAISGAGTDTENSKKQKKKRKKRQTVLVDHGTYSEWAGVAVLQTDWSPKSARVAIVFDDDQYEMEICRGRSLLRMHGEPQVSLNGKPLHRTGDWEEVCWYSDDDVDYLEVEVELEAGVRVQRQVCLLRADDALFVADAVLNKKDERLDYQVSLDLADSISTMRETENNEIYLRGKKDKIRSLVLPLCLSEWQAARSDNSIDDLDNSITLKQSSLGRNLYAAWFIDLSPKRSVKPRTWNPLTVGEGLELASPQVARAFRVRIGNYQWVVYRSFGEIGNRTFLGQNRNCEFFIGRFKEDGTVDELISIE